jgi:hypothetical protein
LILPDDNSDYRPSARRTGILTVVLLCLAVISVAFYTYLQSQNIDLKTLSPGQLFSGFQQKTIKAADVAYEIPYDSKEHPLYAAYKDYLVKCTADGIRLLDKKGQEIFSEGIALTKPLIRVEGAYLLIADVGGMDVYVIKDRNIIWKDKTDTNIINAKINNNGYVTVLTESKQYNGEVRVYDPYGVLLYISVIANDYAVSAEISNKSRDMVIDSVNTKGAEAFTTLKFHDVNGNETAVKNLNASGNLYPSVWYLSDDSLFAAGDTSIAGLDKNGELKWEKKYNKVSGACISNGNHMAAIVQDVKGFELKVLGADGQERAASAIDGEKAGISAKDGIITLNTMREADFYNERAICISKYSSSSDILGVSLFSRQQAAVITKSYIAVVNIG